MNIPYETFYEISSYQNGKWEVIGNENNKISAKNAAHHFLASQHHIKVRIIEEILDPQTDEFTTKIIFTAKSSRALDQSVPDKGKGFWSGKTKQTDHEISEEPSKEKHPRRKAAEELTKRVITMVLIVGGIFVVMGGLIYFYLTAVRPLLE